MDWKTFVQKKNSTYLNVPKYVIRKTMKVIAPISRYCLPRNNIQVALCFWNKPIMQYAMFLVIYMMCFTS